MLFSKTDKTQAPQRSSIRGTLLNFSLTGNMSSAIAVAQDGLGANSACDTSIAPAFGMSTLTLLDTKVTLTLGNLQLREATTHKVVVATES